MRAADCGKAVKEEARERHQQLIRLADYRIQQHFDANPERAQQKPQTKRDGHGQYQPHPER